MDEDLTLVSRQKSFGGWTMRYRHRSHSTQCEMIFGLFLPPQAEQKKVPLLYWLSGLTCTDENFMQKAGAHRLAAELGLAIVTPDTSPRGAEVPGDPQGSWDFGLGAGFYINATQQPWKKHYQMHDYVVKELPELLEKHFPVNQNRGISGHSMGGHGALICALRHPQRYRSVSAFSPICHPVECPWGQKAFGHYLGSDRTQWDEWDASLLLARSQRMEILVDQGEADDFLDMQLKPDALLQAAQTSGAMLNLRMQKDYDHGYYFVASFMDDHLRYHAEKLFA